VLLSAQLDLLTERDGAGRRSEIVLAEAGLSRAEVAQLVGRNPEAVRSSLRRAAKKLPAS
jgi:DNA-directed RNA polymerase specialized sigma24 family protein